MYWFDSNQMMKKITHYNYNTASWIAFAEQLIIDKRNDLIHALFSKQAIQCLDTNQKIRYFQLYADQQVRLSQLFLEEVLEGARSHVLVSKKGL